MIRNDRERIRTLEELPDICTPQIVADYTGISRRRIYEFSLMSEEVGGIKSYTIGKSRKIDKLDLIDWLGRMKKN